MIDRRPVGLFKYPFYLIFIVEKMAPNSLNQNIKILTQISMKGKMKSDFNGFFLRKKKKDFVWCFF